MQRKEHAAVSMPMAHRRRVNGVESGHSWFPFICLDYLCVLEELQVQ